MIIGKHLIAGEWVDGERVFQSDPAHGPAHEFAVGSVAHVDEACTQAEEAF
jgi:2,5-dioxopentanoate dehydrogenase